MRRAAIRIVVTWLALLGLACGGGSDKPATPTPNRAVFIESITPGSGTIGTEVVIRGYGFDSEENDIGFKSSQTRSNWGDRIYHNNVPSEDGSTLRFQLPDTLGACAVSLTGGCEDIGFELPIGEITISVTNRRGTSNELEFDREISAIEEAQRVVGGSEAMDQMTQALNDIVQRSGQPGGPYGTGFGLGFRESDNGEFYIELTVSGMADTEVRAVVPEDIEGYEIKCTLTEPNTVPRPTPRPCRLTE